MGKYLRHFESIAAATGAQDLLAPNVTLMQVSGVDKILMKNGTGVEELQISGSSLDDLEIKEKATGPEMVDLGLPSGTLWAKCNIGATSETAAGKYFAWGDAEGFEATITQYTGYGRNQAGDLEDEGLYCWTKGSNNVYSREEEVSVGSYLYDGADLYYVGSVTVVGPGSIDYETRTCPGKFSSTWYDDRPGKSLRGNIADNDATHNAAYAAYGAGYTMPNQADFNELINGTNHSWTTVGGVNGHKFTNKTDVSKYIFIPAAYYGYDGFIRGVGRSGSVWSSDINSIIPCYAYFLGFYRNGYIDVDGDNGYRYLGYSVRAIKKQS